MMTQHIPDHSERRFDELRQERLKVQQKTFTKWANVHLQKHGMQIENLFVDLADGRKLMKLLEILTGEKLGKPATGTARINKIENVSRCLAFLQSRKMRLENISAEDIVDGKQNLILGLLWMVILRNEIAPCEPVTKEKTESVQRAPVPEQKIAKDSLLLWCQTKTEGYPGVRIKDFKGSWRDGLGFNALIHSHLPSLVDYLSLNPRDHIGNLHNAFNVAEKHIGVPKLLDPIDIATDNPDEKSILIYVALFCKALGVKMKEITGGKRIANIIAQMMDIDNLKNDYEISARQLMQWIYSTIESLNMVQEFATLQDIQEEMMVFKNYRTVEKPVMYQSRNEVDARFFALHMKQKGLGQAKSLYVPPEAISVNTIEEAWGELERAEYEHESILRDELKHQERLENLAFKFNNKYLVRDGYLKEMKKILLDPKYGTNVGQLDATIKKHEAVRAGIFSREDMLLDLFRIADVLINENYWNKDNIEKRKKEMEGNWNYVTQLLEAYDRSFDSLKTVKDIICEMDAVVEEIKQMQDRMNSYDTGRHLLDVEDLLQKHKLDEAHIKSWKDTIQRLDDKVQTQVNEKHREAPVLMRQQTKLDEHYKRLVEAAENRNSKLENSLKYYKFIQDLEDQLAWILEKQISCSSSPVGKDPSSILPMQQKHKSLEMEIKARKQHAEKIEQSGLKLIQEQHSEREHIMERLKDLKSNSDILHQLWKEKDLFLENVKDLYQFEADASEIECLIVEKEQLMSSSDFGKDELTSKALLHRHANLEREILLYSSSIEQLRKTAEEIREYNILPPKSTVVNREQMQQDSSGQKSSKRNLRDVDKLQKFEGFEKHEAKDATLPSNSKVMQRQRDIEVSYEMLKHLAQDRCEKLRNAAMYFSFNDKCYEVDSWIKKKIDHLSSKTYKMNFEERRREFENLVTDLASYNSRVEQLTSIVKGLENKNHEQYDVIRLKYDKLMERWLKLNRLKTDFERDLKGADSLNFFYRTCDEACEWMYEKLQKVETTDYNLDIKTIQTLQRKHEMFERELVPVRERVHKVQLLYKSVLSSHSSEAENIDDKMCEVEEVWQLVQKKANERKLKLEDTFGFQIFKSLYTSVLSWIKDTIQTLSIREKISDVNTGEDFIKDHQDTGNNIISHDDEYFETYELGMKLIQNKNQRSEDIEPMLQLLEREKEYMLDLWKSKGDWLRQCLDLQILVKEVDQIDSICTSHCAFLEYDDLGTTLDDVEMLLKRHNDFMNTVNAQDERLAKFDDVADKLISVGHPESSFIDSQRNKIIEKRKLVKQKCQERKNLLLTSYKLQQFKADANEVSTWISEKMRVASEYTYKSISSPQRKLNYHEAFEAELKKNEDRLDNINSEGQSLILESHYASDNISNILAELNQSWNSLCIHIQENRQKIEHELMLANYNKLFDNIVKKTDELKLSLASEYYGNDLSTIRSLMKKQQILDAEVEALKGKLEELMVTGEEMIDEKHFDATNIERKNTLAIDSLSALSLPMSKRHQKLQESFKFHQFKFQIEREELWINEHIPLAIPDVTVRSLFEAQKLQKRNENLEQEISNHQPIIDGLLKQQETFVDNESPTDEVQKLCLDLSDKWNNLVEMFKTRRSNLNIVIKVQMFYSESNEIESWLNEKLEALSNTDYGKDEDAVIKLLTKNKALDLEVDTYQGLVVALNSQAQELIDAHHPEAKIVENRMEVINQEMKNVQKLSSLRRQKLLESKSKYEFFKETEELKDWIGEQMSVASSDDFGVDYEHLLELRSKFDFFQSKIQAGSKRVIQYEEFGKKLISNGCDFIQDVQNNMDYLSREWALLLEHIDARVLKMDAACEIHRYNRDICDILSRIHEKYAILPTDLGRNLMSVQDLLKQHDNYENDLLAIEAQVQLLLEDSERLQSSYPGENAEHINQQIVLVVENWNSLQNKVAWRKGRLLASYRLQMFLASARDIETWAKEILATLKTEDKARNLETIQNMNVEHKHIRSEIDTRNATFDAVIQEGHKLVDDDILEDNDSQEQVIGKVNELCEIKDDVLAAWHKKNNFIGQLLAYQQFLRDLKQLNSFINVQEVYLNRSETRETVEEIDNDVKKHMEFLKLVACYEEKMESLMKFGTELIEDDHLESSEIKCKLDEASQRMNRIKDLSHEKSRKLSDALLYSKFKRDAVEAESWISEKKSKLQGIYSHTDALTLEDKMKVLQKHQAFQAELISHENSINRIKEEGEILPSEDSDKFSEAQTMLNRLVEKWNSLVENSGNLALQLEEAQDIVAFNDEVEKIETWIKEKLALAEPLTALCTTLETASDNVLRGHLISVYIHKLGTAITEQEHQEALPWVREGKELMVQAHDTGEDYEHCTAILRKLDDVDSDMRIDESRVENINSLAQKLVSEGQFYADTVRLRQEAVNKKWKSLKTSLDLYRNDLLKAVEIHRCIRDIDETLERIHEKRLILLVSDDFNDLDTIKALMRRQEILGRDLSAIEIKLEDHNSSVLNLSQKFPHATDDLNKKLEETQRRWTDLINLLEDRKKKLNATYKVQKYVCDVNDIEKWSNDIISRMEFEELASNLEEAEKMLISHQEIMSDIKAKEGSFSSLKNYGTELLETVDLQAEIVEQKLQLLDELSVKVSISWEERRHILTECCSLQTFLEKAKQVERWISSKEAFLNSEDLGDSVASTEALIRKHENFEKTMVNQMDKIDDLKTFAEELIEGDHYESFTVQSRLHDICQRQEVLKERAASRRKLLEKARVLHQFLLEIYEVSNWIDQKVKVAVDESFKDLSNIPNKIQKHEAFEAEILANHDRLVSVIFEGKSLVSNAHYAANDIENHIDNLQQLWNQLLDESSIRKERLQDSYEALQFVRKLDEINAWMDEVETQLLDFNSEKYEKDLSSAKDLLIKLEQLESDLNEHAERLRLIKEDGDKYLDDRHFLKPELEKQLTATINRFEQLHESLAMLRENLDDAVVLLKLYRDIDDEISWIQEKKALCISDDFGENISEVRNLQKRHQALKTEIYNHELLLSSIIDKGKTKRSDTIDNKIANLQTQLQELKDLSAIRRLRLIDALESQTYYYDVILSEIWIKDKLHLISSSDLGKDVESVEVLIKKSEEIRKDVENYESSIKDLKDISSGLIERSHFDSDNIAKIQTEIESDYSHLIRQITARQKSLRESKRYFVLVKDINNLSMQLKTMLHFTRSEDYGRDVEHVEILIQKFEPFSGKLQPCGETLSMLKHSAQSLIDDKHPESDSIKEKIDEIVALWNDIKESAAVRSKALDGAKLVHSFNKRADEVIEWIHEKDIMFSSEDYGRDLESIKSLLRHHETIELDVKAINDQVTTLGEEANAVITKFPGGKEQVETKREAIEEALNECLKKSSERKDKLLQAEQIQTYFAEHREILAWLNEMMSLITHYELPEDVASAESLIDLHKEYRSEIETHLDACKQFQAKGEDIISSGHFMKDEIREKINQINVSAETLLETWKNRQTIYEQNLDLQCFKKDIRLLESWLQNREGVLQEDVNAESIEEVDDLIKKYEEFIKSLEMYDEKFTNLKRITKLEDSYFRNKEEEEIKKKAEEEQRKQEKISDIKEKEQRRILETRMRDDNQSFLENNMSSGRLSTEYSEDDMPLELPETDDSVFKRTDKTIFGSRRSNKSDVSLKLNKPQDINTSPKPVKPKTIIPTFAPPPITAEGVLERKQVLQTGGKSSTSRQWKKYYTTLCGHLLSFYKDKSSSLQQNPAKAKPPVTIFQAVCSEANDYKKRKHVFRLGLKDKSELLFMAPNENVKKEWISKINFNASLLPRMQLQKYETMPHVAEERQKHQEPPEDPTYKHMSSVDADYDDIYNLNSRETSSVSKGLGGTSSVSKDLGETSSISKGSDKEFVETTSKNVESSDSEYFTPEIYENVQSIEEVYSSVARHKKPGSFGSLQDTSKQVDQSKMLRGTKSFSDNNSESEVKLRSHSLKVASKGKKAKIFSAGAEHLPLKQSKSHSFTTEQLDEPQKQNASEKSSTNSTPSPSESSLTEPPCTPTPSSRSSYCTAASSSNGSTSTLQGQDFSDEDYYSVHGDQEEIRAVPRPLSYGNNSLPFYESQASSTDQSHHLSLQRSSPNPPKAEAKRSATERGERGHRRDKGWRSMLNLVRRH